ncbi:mucoidy inhibitor MuiA family protein [Tengunoibacter tsumagoiensis]|uniref:Mucoidy inhibitor MuiA family protein n=1 Tax=Tengunoibacter tsumagoiensis TaxID=2014871 RepID=A0A402A2V3_9CHLR|nr:mucoidy inhibitor MuiA family protein [Tengunoibacter tsumagoiensis]GCE13376.1 hypothetical protein KTT_32350 [Tengunoibacter tsumagoiensis]
MPAQNLDAPIIAVTVYTDRALVTRQCTLHLSSGTHDLRINNLPQFIRDSLRASGEGPQGTRILNVDVSKAFYSQPPEASLQALQREIDLLVQQKELLRARQDSLNDRRQWLRSLGEQSHDFAKGLAQGQMKPQDCSDFFQFMATQSLQDAETAQQLELQIHSIEQEIQARYRELRPQQQTTSPDRLAANVTIELAQEGDVTIAVSYITKNASWYPQYDVRVQFHDQPGAGTVELTYLGMVRQSTGEAWNAVRLSLSTARPSLSATLPELQPWYLNVVTPMAFGKIAPGSFAQSAGGAPAPSRSRLMSSDESALDDFADTLKEKKLDLPPPPVAAEVATANVEQTGTALVFHIGHSVDIPSDNSPHKTTIARHDLPCQFDYVTAPALEKDAHLRATITNTAEQVLLKGEANIFLSGEYVGTTQVRQTASNEQFKIFLGIDDSIKITREPTERSVEKGNLLQNDLRRNIYAYRITVHNYAHVARKIVVRDHLPVSQHERIKFKLQSIQPQPTEQTKLSLLTWEFTLAPDAEQKIDYRFLVEYPQGLQITGLPPTGEVEN